MNHWGWVRFWSVRHPNAAARAKFERALSDADAAAGRIAEKAETHLRKRGIRVLESEKG